MYLSQAKALLVDKFLSELVSRSDGETQISLSIKDYVKIENDRGQSISEKDIHSAIIIANYKQHKYGFTAFEMNARFIDLMVGTTEAFMEAGGFSAIWEEEHKERKDKFDTNESIRTTNAKTWVLAALAALFSFVTMVKELWPKPEPKLPEIESQLQKQSQSLENIGLFLKENQTKYVVVKDSVKISKYK